MPVTAQYAKHTKDFWTKRALSRFKEIQRKEYSPLIHSGHVLGIPHDTILASYFDEIQN